MPVDTHRQAGVARIEPVTVPTGGGPHVDRKLDLAARRRWPLGEEPGLDPARADERRDQQHGKQDQKAAEHIRGHCEECSDEAIRFTSETFLIVSRNLPSGAPQAGAGLGLVEVRPKPSLGLLERDAAPRRIILQLVAADPRDSEILAVTMAKIETRH